MAYTAREPYIVEQAIADNSTTQKHNLGQIVRAYDSTYGEGEFIYLQGVASTIVGSVVEYDSAYVTGLATLAVNTPRAIAVAMSACVASEYGWYQIGGQAVMGKASTLSLTANKIIGAASGLVIDVVTGLVMEGALVAVVSSATSGGITCRVMINRPTGPGEQ